MNYDVIIIGAGASGLMCAAQSGLRGRRTLVLDHHHRSGHKIVLAGGGKCNFTNMELNAKEHYLCKNKFFPISALSRFSQWDFLEKMDGYCINYEERDHGRLFCTHHASEILHLLNEEVAMSGDLIKIQMDCSIDSVSKEGSLFCIETNQGQFQSESLVIATGGLSYPKVGASPFGHTLAEQFGLQIVKPHPGLTPLIVNDPDLTALAGLSFEVSAEIQGHHFKDSLLITHRGLSGPVSLQCSNYWHPGEAISINLIPSLDLSQFLAEIKQEKQKKLLRRVLSEFLPKRFVLYLIKKYQLNDCEIRKLSPNDIELIAKTIHHWEILPAGKEFYHLAEVTVGGVDTDEISSKTMEAKKVSGLFFIGEVLDVTGHLGGYNLQWAWSSGFCAGQYT
jgi:predicted Rossmann fold flavoprotein